MRVPGVTTATCLSHTLRTLTGCLESNLQPPKCRVFQKPRRPVPASCLRHTRSYCAAADHKNSDVSGHVIRSPLPDIQVPDVPFAEFMFSAFSQYGDRLAMVDFMLRKQWTFAELVSDSRRVASGLTRLGLVKGDTLLLLSFNCPEYTLVLLAAAACGITVSTANPVYTPEELARQLSMSGSTALVAAEGLVSNVRCALRHNPDLGVKLKGRKIVLGKAEGFRTFRKLQEDDGSAFPENVDLDPHNDVMLLPYSSGTTGLPKGVMLSHVNVAANVLQQQGLTVGEPGEGRLLGVLPFYHIYGMTVSQWTALHAGNTVVTLPRFTPQDFLAAIKEHQITVTHLVPPLVLFLAKDPSVRKEDIASLQKVVCGAAPLGEGLTKEFALRSDALLLQAYGLTETSPITHFNSPPVRQGTIGKLVSSTEGKIVDVSSGEALGPGETGELLVRGPQVMLGYLDNVAATRATMAEGGWLRTGDLGHYDSDGYFAITDRLKELIKYKGFQVAPAELEALLLTHPSVADAAVIGLPDDAAGELPLAFVVPREVSTFSEQDVNTFINERVAPYKRLRGGLRVVDAIPKTASGKILRRVLKDQVLNG